LAASLLVLVVLVIVYQALGTGFDRWNSALLRRVVVIRTGWLSTASRAVDAGLTSRWTIRLLRLGTLLALLGFRRWRHLLIYLGSVIAVEAAAYQLSLPVASPRPITSTSAGAAGRRSAGWCTTNWA